MKCIVTSIFLSVSILFSSTTLPYNLTSNSYSKGFRTNTVYAQTFSKGSTQKPQESLMYYFTENKGQWYSSIKFIGKTSFGKIIFTSSSIYIQNIEDNVSSFQSYFNEISTIISGRPLKQSFLPGINTTLYRISLPKTSTPVYQGKYKFEHYNNYYYGNNPSDWISHCSNFAEVEYSNVKLNQRVKFTILNRELCTTLSTPYRCKDIDKASTTSSHKTIRFYTSIGGENDDWFTSICYDQNDNLLLSGTTESDDTTFTIGKEIPGFDSTFNGQDTDGFIVKLSPNGEKILYSTYIGGNYNDSIKKIEVNARNEVVIVGTTNSTPDTFPMSEDNPGYKKVYGGSTDIFAIVMDSSCTNIATSTYIGGVNADTAKSMILDRKGNVVICGMTLSDENSFPIGGSVPGYDTSFNQTNDGFVVVINPFLTDLLYSSFFGGDKYDRVSSVISDVNNNLILCGTTYSSESTFPIGDSTPGYDTTFNGESDGFLLGIDTHQNKLLFSTYIGGEKKDTAYDLCLDPKNYIVVVGSTRSNESSFPVKSILKGLDPVYNGMGDGYIVKLNNSASKLVYSTYVGSVEEDCIYNVSRNKEGELLISGETKSELSDTFMSLTTPGYCKSFGGDYDGFLLKCNQHLTTVLYSTYIGGSGYDQVMYSTFSKNNNYLLCGFTNSPGNSGFPPGKAVPGLRSDYENDAFIIELWNEDSLSDPEPEPKPHSFHLVSSIENNAIRLDWVNIQDEIIGYNVYQKESHLENFPDSPINEETVKATTYLVNNNLHPNRKYCFIVIPLDRNNKEFTNIQSRITCIQYIPEENTEPEPEPEPEINLLEIILQVNTPTIWIDKNSKPLDAAPEITQDRMFVPLRIIAEEIGGEVEWIATQRKVAISYYIQSLNKQRTIELYIGGNGGVVNGELKPIDEKNNQVVPYIKNGRTMLPIRFIAESLLAKDIMWDGSTRQATFLFYK